MANNIWRRFPCDDLEDSDYSYNEQEAPYWIIDRAGLCVSIIMREFFGEGDSSNTNGSCKFGMGLSLV